MYYIIESHKLKDETNPIAINAKEDLTLAKMLFHQILASALANDKVISTMALIIDEAGNTVKKEYNIKE